MYLYLGCKGKKLDRSLFFRPADCRLFVQEDITEAAEEVRYKVKKHPLV